jgi:hypothetical protein
MLADEVEKRTRIRLTIAESQSGSGPAIFIGQKPGRLASRLIAAVPGADGYRLQVVDGSVVVAGNDARGTLFGVGALLRHLRMERDALEVADSLAISTAPKYALRGHQLGYRPKTNSYDGWSVPVWEQYLRDLAVFGTNAIELIPPRSDDDADSPHFPLPPMQMMVEMSRLADNYGLDVSIWYPAMDKDYSDPKTVEFALHEWSEVFRQLPRIDAVFVPGGDPGHTEPKYLMALLEKETEALHRYHPKAQMWVSPQSRNYAPRCRSGIPSGTIPTSRTAANRNIRCPIGTWLMRSPKRARRSIRGRWTRRISSAYCSPTRSDSSPIPKAAMTM